MLSRETRRARTMKIRLSLLCLNLALGLAGCAGTQRAAQPDAPPSPTVAEQLQQVRQQYTEGRYGEVIRWVATSDALAGAPRQTRTEAYKLQAFSYCVTGYPQLCEDTFLRVLRMDPAFTLAPNEAGHPLWGPVFRKAQAKAAE